MSIDGAVTLWDVETAHRETLRGHSVAVVQPVFSPDGKTLGTASHDGTTIAWNPSDQARAGAAAHVHARPAVSSLSPISIWVRSASTDG